MYIGIYIYRYIVQVYKYIYIHFLTDALIIITCQLYMPRSCLQSAMICGARAAAVQLHSHLDNTHYTHNTYACCCR